MKIYLSSEIIYDNEDSNIKSFIPLFVTNSEELGYKKLFEHKISELRKSANYLRRYESKQMDQAAEKQENYANNLTLDEFIKLYIDEDYEVREMEVSE